MGHHCLRLWVRDSGWRGLGRGGGEGRRLRFGPAPGVVRGSEGEEGKGKGSVVSRGTEWPTQSGVGGGRF